MLVLVGPSFNGTESAYQQLSQLTGLVPYELRSRLKPGMWGLLRVLADSEEAARLAALLIAAGFPAVAVPRDVAADPQRPIVALQGLELGADGLVLKLRERNMTVPHAAVCCIVRGEAQVGRVTSAARSPGSASSSSTFRAVVPSASDLQVFRESMPPVSFEAFAAADLHFHSVYWIARIDARAFDFELLGIDAAAPASALDTLADRLAALCKVRVDRAARASSVNSFAQQAATRIPTPYPAPSQRGREIAGDERFDPYSRIIGEAERLLAQQHARKAAGESAP
jgi:hypothetical protein